MTKRGGEASQAFSRRPAGARGASREIRNPRGLGRRRARGDGAPDPTSRSANPACMKHHRGAVKQEEHILRERVTGRRRVRKGGSATVASASTRCAWSFLTTAGVGRPSEARRRSGTGGASGGGARRGRSPNAAETSRRAGKAHAPSLSPTGRTWRASEAAAGKSTPLDSRDLFRPRTGFAEATRDAKRARRSRASRSSARRGRRSREAPSATCEGACAEARARGGGKARSSVRRLFFYVGSPFSADTLEERAALVDFFMTSRETV